MNYSSDYSESSVSISDLVSYLLYKWLFIIVSMIIFGVVFAGVRLSRVDTSSLDKTDALRAKLSEEELLEANGVITRYTFCLDYVLGRTDNLRLMRNMYQIDTGSYPANALSKVMFLNDEEYKLISETLEMDANEYCMPSDRISIESFVGSEETNSGLFVVASVYGESDAQCVQVMSIIEKSLDRLLSVIEQKTESTGWEMVSSVSSSSDNFNSFYTREEKLERLSKVGSTLSGLSNAVNYLSEGQKEYINSVIKPLKNNLFEPNEETKFVSVTKSAVLGAGFGLILSTGALVIIYLFDGKIRTSADIGTLSDSFILDPIYVPRNNNRVVRNVINKLKGVDGEKITVNKAIAITRLSTTIRETDPKRIVLVLDSNSEQCKALADEFMTNEEIVSSRVVLRGDMSDFANLCLSLTEDDAVILLAEMGKTKQKSISRWIDFCKKNGKSIAGVATVDQNC